MSSAIPGTSDPFADDPFARGWRVVTETGPDGAVVEREIPLTEEDLLHPEEGDVIVQNDPHHREVMYLFYVFDTVCSPRGDHLVLSDHRVAWGVRGIRPHCPDVVVFDGSPEWDRTRLETFPAGEVVARPLLVVEVTSPSTRRNDLEPKRDQYYRLGIPYYLIIDRLAGPSRDAVQLVGLRRGPKGWRQARPNEQGRLLLPTVDLWVGVEGDRVVCYDEEGEPYPVYSEAMSRLSEEVETRREALRALEIETQGRAAAERKLIRSRQQARRERQRRQEADQRADQAEADAAALRDEMARMKAEMDRLRGGQG